MRMKCPVRAERSGQGDCAGFGRADGGADHGEATEGLVVMVHENVPAAGAAILASNHMSVIDRIFLPLVLKRAVVVLANLLSGKKSVVRGGVCACHEDSTSLAPVSLLQPPIDGRDREPP